MFNKYICEIFGLTAIKTSLRLVCYIQFQFCFQHKQEYCPMKHFTSIMPHSKTAITYRNTFSVLIQSRNVLIAQSPNEHKALFVYLLFDRSNKHHCFKNYGISKTEEQMPTLEPSRGELAKFFCRRKKINKVCAMKTHTAGQRFQTTRTNRFKMLLKINTPIIPLVLS